MPSRCAASAATSAGLLRFHAALVHVTDAAGPELHCTDALLATRRTISTVGLTDLDWIAAVLAALDERRPLPPPSDRPERVWETPTPTESARASAGRRERSVLNRQSWSPTGRAGDPDVGRVMVSSVSGPVRAGW